MTIESTTLEAKIKKNKRYKQLVENLGSDRYNIPFSVMRTEIKQLHSGRMLSQTRPTSPKFGRKFIEAAQVEVSVRSRLTEMRATLTHIQSDFKSAIDHLHDYLCVKYSDRLRIFKTIKERDRFLTAILRDFYEYLRKIDTLLAEIAFVVEDIDKSGYAMKSMVDLYSVIFKNEGRIVR
tara:strand:+ start:1895 stop:2431 length:537 start_codon:yes stop_codon:yes gene_type:complete